MKTLFDKIRYDHKLYSELTDSTGKREIAELAIKLQDLGSEIIACDKGEITIMPSGNVFTVSFQEDLAAKITKIVTGRP